MNWSSRRCWSTGRVKGPLWEKQLVTLAVGNWREQTGLQELRGAVREAGVIAIGTSASLQRTGNLRGTAAPAYSQDQQTPISEPFVKGL